MQKIADKQNAGAFGYDPGTGMGEKRVFKTTTSTSKNEKFGGRFCETKRERKDPAMIMIKGAKPKNAKYARGGECVTTRSRFMKEPDPFRTGIQRSDYDKKTKGGEMSKTIEKKA